jgi:hypothetical protein
MSVYDSIIVFDKGSIGEKVPMEIGKDLAPPPDDRILTIRTH